jgi:hypothetical protein
VLTRRPAAAALTVGAAASAALMASIVPAPRASADAGPVACPPEQTVCTVQVQGSAETASAKPAGKPASARAGSACRIPQNQPNAGSPVPCSTPQFGWWSNADGCYFKRLDPQPASSDPTWQGHYPDGAVYEMVCPNTTGTAGGWVWRGAPPAGAGGPAIDPAVLAQRALRQLTLSGPAIRTAPPAGSVGIVRVPVWLWTEVTPATWGPASATAAVPGLSVTATAHASKIVWNLGDGHSVTCTGPGTEYRPDLGASRSPTCGHVYERSSAGQPGDAYTVTAVTTWQITWAGGGQTGALTVTRSSSTQVRIAEMQVLT